MATRGCLAWARRMGFLPTAEPIGLQRYSETLQKFRRAAQGHGAMQPPDEHRERVATYFDPLPMWYEPFEGAQVDAGKPLSPRERGWGEGRDARDVADDAALCTSPLPNPALQAGEGAKGGSQSPDQDQSHSFPLSAVTQRPMFMYHAWGSQNAWLRQIAARNWLYLHPDTGERYGIGDEDWIEVVSHHGRIVVQAKFAANVQPDTVWTWNAIGKRRGAWRLGKDAPEGRQGFLLNHLISDITPRGDYANADPVTGQAAWFDLRVRIAKVADASASAPQFAALELGEADDRPLRYGAQFRAAREKGTSR